MPISSTWQTNGMPMAPSVLAPGLNENGQIPSLAFLYNVVNKNADYTVLETESGTVFTSGSAVTFTLPDATVVPSGTNYKFIQTADFNMTVSGSPADCMVAFNDAEADSIAFSTTSEKIGGAVEVVSNGAKWLVFAHLGAETQTPTIATS